MGARWVTQSTWRPAALAASFWPTTSATRPPIPASTSSKTSTGTSSAAARTVFAASITRDSSPPETTLARGRRSSPGLAESSSSALSAPRGPTRQPSGPAASSPTAAGSRRRATRKRPCSIPSPRISFWMSRSRRSAPRVRGSERAEPTAPRPRPAWPSQQRALHLLGDRVVARDAVERGRDFLPVGEDRGHRVPVLALELHDGVEPSVDLLEPLGVEDRAVPQGPRPAHHVLQIGLRALDGLDGGGRVRLVAREVAQERGRAAEPRGGGLRVLGEAGDRLLQPGHDPLRVLQA